MVRTTLLSFLAFFAVLEPAVAALPPKPDMRPIYPDFDLNTEVFDFPTGLRILFQSDRSYPVVSMYMIVDHGSSDDPAGKDEVAHFVEHTWFRSRHGDLPPIMNVVGDLSGFMNATTGNDRTNYYMNANSEYLPILMRLESLRLTEFYRGVTEDFTTTEREVIRNEWRLRNENGYALLFDYLYNVLYPEDHPYHSTSTHDTIDSITLTDLKAYVDKYYKPDQTTLAVVGDFDPREASSIIFESFDPSLLHPRLTADMYFQYPKPGVANPDPANPSHWLTGAYDPDEFLKGKRVPFKYVDGKSIRPRITEQRAPVPELGNRELVREKAPLDYTTAVVGWSLPGAFREDHTQLVVLGEMAGLLVQNVHDAFPAKALRDVGCFTQTEKVNSTLVCYAEIKSSHVRPEDVPDKLIDQMALIWDLELTDAIKGYLARAAASQQARTMLTLDNVMGLFDNRADTIGTFAHNTGNPNYYSWFLKQLGTLQTSQMQAMAAQYLKRDRAARLIIEKLPEEDVDKNSSKSGYTGASRADDMVVASDNLSLATEAEIAAARLTPDMTRVTDYQLPNGMRVIVMPHGEVPTAQASILIGGGTDTSPPLVFDLVSEFTTSSSTDPLQVAGSTSWFASSMQSYPLLTNAWPNALRLDMTVPSGNVDAALWTLRSELEHMIPNTSGLADWKSSLKSSLKRGWTERDWHIADLQTQHLYPGSPVKQMLTWEQVEAMKTVGASAITEWLDTHINPSNAVLFVVGHIKPEEVKKQVETYFGGWDGRGTAQGWMGKLTEPAMPTEQTKVYIIDDPKRTQSDTQFQCRLNYSGEPDRPVVGVLGSLIGERVFSTLRVKEALAYTPYAFAAVGDDQSAVLTMASAALNSGIGRTVEYFFEVARQVENGAVQPGEVTVHKLREARGNGLGAQSLSQMVGTLSGPVRRGDPWSVITNAGKDVAGVAPEQLRKMIAGCTDHAVITIQGPKDIVAAQLDSKGIAYEIVDYEKRGDDLLQKYDPKAYDKKMKAKAKEDAKKAKEEAKKGGEKPADDEGKPPSDTPTDPNSFMAPVARIRD